MARNVLGSFVLAVVVSGVSSGAAVAADSAEIDAMTEKGVAFLLSQQGEDGSFSGETGTGISALVTTALLKSGKSPTDPALAKALAFLENNVHDDGGVYPEGSRHKNYETCLAINAFLLANQDGKYDETLNKAEAFLKKEQWDEEEKLNPSSPAWGGAGYGGHSRPDLSNTSFFIDTLKELGRGEEDPAIQRALVFVSRCQNLESKYNETEFASKNPDGGFYYTIAAGGSSPAGTTPEGGLRSYGSMTYAGLKSMIYAGVGPDDPRVKAAKQWIAEHYTLDENPQMADSGLYYYYHTFAKALAAVGDVELVDKDGNSHNWREELVAQLASLQKPDGSWSNSNERWLESNPNLVTGYVLLALAQVRDAAN